MTNVVKPDLKFGDKVKVAFVLKRSCVDDASRSYIYTEQQSNAIGIFLGWRTVSDGYIGEDYDPLFWMVTKYISCALVAFNTSSAQPHFAAIADGKNCNESTEMTDWTYAMECTPEEVTTSKT